MIPLFLTVSIIIGVWFAAFHIIGIILNLEQVRKITFNNRTIANIIELSVVLFLILLPALTSAALGLVSDRMGLLNCWRQ